MLARRSVLSGLAAALAGGPRARAAERLKLGPPAPFSFEALKARARELAGRAFEPPPRPAPEVLQRIDYDAHGRIRFKTDCALWADGPSDWPVTFFHLGRFFQTPSRMHVVEG